MLDLRTAEWSLLTEVAGGVCNASPDFGGDWITWLKTEIDGDIILARNLVTGEQRQITSSGEKHGFPATDGRYIVYTSGSGSTQDIYAYDIETAEVFPAVVAPGLQGNAAFQNGKLTWIDLRDSSNEIYGFTSAYYERGLPDGAEVLVRPARSPLIYGREVGDGLVWLDDRERPSRVYAMPAR